MALCSIDGCDKPIRARTWCNKHWQRWYLHGDPTFIKTGRGLTTPERFWRMVERTETCWLWTGSSSRSYGYFIADSTVTPAKRGPAHVYAYELLVGPVPEGMEIDHLCRRKKCVNPAHLEAVTHAENMRRAWAYRIPVEPLNSELGIAIQGGL